MPIVNGELVKLKKEYSKIAEATSPEAKNLAQRIKEINYILDNPEDPQKASRYSMQEVSSKIVDYVKKNSGNLSKLGQKYLIKELREPLVNPFNKKSDASFETWVRKVKEYGLHSSIARNRELVESLISYLRNEFYPAEKE